eukprot:TRINITY_DN6852_c0_g1_i2.p1 TRINITY_DN6852_c0_g1~~TRINITY_DN6852_c0_g1_i2.p1  ORF type:complete len:272 (+),score=41.10 TRINITY_DN6852_c0_g1_i2:25-840(+)
MIDSFIKSSRTLINRMYSSRTESLVRKGVVSPLRRVPSTIKRPPYVGINDTSLPVSDQMSTIYRLTPAEVNVMRAAGKIARQTMDHISKHVKAGITTDSLDVIAHTYILSKNAYPSPLLYSGFPKSICTSVNEVVCHGIPDSRILREGDILNVDITVYYHGYHADMSDMFLIGDVDDESKDLVEMTRKCLEKAIQVCGPGVPFNTIGEVTETLANENGYNIQPDFTGHGIGKHFHSGPHVYHSHIQHDLSAAHAHIFSLSLNKKQHLSQSF